MNNTTLVKEYKEAGMKMLMGRDEINYTTYYWKPEMGLAIAENELGDIGIVYKTKETLPDNIAELLKYIEDHSEDGVLSINAFTSIKETRAFIATLFKSLTGPDHVGVQSNHRVFWRCAHGHNFKARIADRVKGSGCPFCYAERIKLKKDERIKSLSAEKKQAAWIRSMRLTKREKGRIDREFPEMAILYYAVKAGLRLLQNDEEKIGIPIQYYFPDISGAIELNSKKRSYDTVREICENRLCAKNNIRLVRIIDPECEANDECYYCLYLEDRSARSLERAMRSAFSILGVNADVDLKRDYRMILS